MVRNGRYYLEIIVGYFGLIKVPDLELPATSEWLQLRSSLDGSLLRNLPLLSDELALLQRAVLAESSLTTLVAASEGSLFPTEESLAPLELGLLLQVLLHSRSVRQLFQRC